jgi:DNA mismatch endonuclease (patch repair protein)
MGFRFRLHVRGLPGRPDLVLPRHKKIIFVHGCFWHWHEGCKEAHLPKSRLEYWRPKLEGNRQRDKRHRSELSRMGWKVLVVWECETFHESRLQKRLVRFLEAD